MQEKKKRKNSRKVIGRLESERYIYVFVNVGGVTFVAVMKVTLNVIERNLL